MEAAVAVDEALKATEAFADAFGWQLNHGKVVLWSSSARHRAHFRGLYPQLKVATCAVDLGVVVQAGKGRRCAVRAARLLEGARQATKIATLSLVSLSLGLCRLALSGRLSGCRR